MSLGKKYLPILARVGCKSDLGKASKMPCPTFSLPAQACKTGQKLAQVEGSVCEGCYADGRGNYRWDTVQTALYRRLSALASPTWTSDMIQLIGASDAARVGYFRWHDSGDIQSLAHLSNINNVAWALPGIKFWLPTREVELVRKFVKTTRVAPNLIIRLSSAMIDSTKAPRVVTQDGSTLPVSFVHTGVAARARGTRVCPAPKQEGKCQSCRNCWNPELNISYHKY